MSTCEYIFVYGTLRKNLKYGMHRLLMKFSDFIGKGTFNGKLFMINGYPGAVPSHNQNDQVYGEVYYLRNPALILPKLDAYEECSLISPQPPEYVREKVDIKLMSGEHIKAWIYIYNRSTNGLKQIESGNFVDLSTLEKASSPGER